MAKFDEEELRKEIKAFAERRKSEAIESEDFSDFRNELIPVHFSLYEKGCNFCATILNIKADPKKEADLQEAIETCHLNTTTTGTAAFAVLFPVFFIVTGMIFSFLITTFLLGGEGRMFMMAIFVFIGLMMIIPLGTLPMLLANQWRLKASNQMVLSIFYLVSYMRHTSNLELAIKFTSDHLSPPLSIDFKKILWNVETSKFNSVKDALDDYLDKWKKYNIEFVECMHLIESSLYEPSEKKRLQGLEKSLTLILEATYEKMLHYAQDLKGPITTLHMLGVILPILGLVILPLVVSFMGDVRWYHIAFLYNLFLPLVVWYFGKTILSTRPSGYGQADITEINPELNKYRKLDISLFGKKHITVDPKWISLVIISFFFLLSISPLILRMATTSSSENYDIILNKKFDFVSIQTYEAENDAKFSLLGYKLDSLKKPIGPYGLGSTLISLLFPFGMALGLSFYYKSSTKVLIVIRDKTKELEDEFASALFQLGNRVGDGLPAEIAFVKVAEITANTNAGKFFSLVTSNIEALGMGVESAIFDKKYGAINKFPSALIESSMKVFVESAKKGPDVASEALINISTYIKEMHRVDERLKDLMSEVTSSMSSQINFLAPLIAGIVIGLTSLITTILNKLGTQVTKLAEDTATGAATPGGGMLEMFKDSIPTFYFQFVIGLYIVQITYLLTTMLNTIQSGYDPLEEKHMLGQYFYKSGMLYCSISLVVIMIFNIIAALVIDLNFVG
jgi:hypothetical protein